MQRRAFLATVVGATAVGTAGCLGGPPGQLAPSSDESISADGMWNQPGGGPGHANAADGPGPGDAVESRWRYTGRNDESLRPRAVVDGTVFATDDGTIVAIDAADGEEQWRAPVADADADTLAVGPNNVYRPEGWVPRDPDDASLTAYTESSDNVTGLTLLEDTLLYVAGDNAVATDPGGSEPRWSVRFEAEPSGLYCVDDTVGVEVDGSLVGLALSDGGRRWRYDEDLAESHSLHVAGRAGRFYVSPVPDGPLRAVDAATGAERWRYEHGFEAYVSATDDHVVIGGTPRQGLKHQVEVLDVDGEQQWATPEERNDSTYFPPVVTDDAVYASHVAGVFAYDLESGDERWDLYTDGLQGLLGGDLYPIGNVIPAGSGLFLRQDGDVYGLGPA